MLLNNNDKFTMPIELIKRFVTREDIQILIGENKFSEVYEAFYRTFREDLASNLTKLFDSADIDFLPHLEYLPRFIFNKCSFSNKYLELPDNIKTIESSSFRLCKNLEVLVIDKNCEKLEEEAFAHCNVNKIIFKNSKNKILKLNWYNPNDPNSEDKFKDDLWIPESVEVLFNKD